MGLEEDPDDRVTLALYQQRHFPEEIAAMQIIAEHFRTISGNIYTNGTRCDAVHGITRLAIAANHRLFFRTYRFKDGSEPL